MAYQGFQQERISTYIHLSRYSFISTSLSWYQSAESLQSFFNFDFNYFTKSMCESPFRRVLLARWSLVTMMTLATVMLWILMNNILFHFMFINQVLQHSTKLWMQVCKKPAKNLIMKISWTIDYKYPVTTMISIKNTFYILAFKTAFQEFPIMNKRKLVCRDLPSHCLYYHCIYDFYL